MSNTAPHNDMTGDQMTRFCSYAKKGFPGYPMHIVNHNAVTKISIV